MVFFVVMTSVSSVSATPTVYVNATGGSDSNNGTIDYPYLTVGKGISTVEENGTVQIADGVYSGEGNTNLTISRSMIITGQSQKKTIINGTDINWIFNVSTGVTVIIQNLTITNATAGCLDKYGGYCGGVICNYGNITVGDCNFIGNNANMGGAICNYGNFTLRDCNFDGNTAGYGGVIYNYMNAIGSLSNCNFTNNTARYSGGAIINMCTITALKDCNFAGNTAYWGGAIFNRGPITSLSGCNFINCNATYGGGICNDNMGNIGAVSGCIFTDNNATYGGAICNIGQGNIDTVSGCIFTDNNATYGGAIYNYYSTVSVHFNRFVNNTATQGNVIYNVGSSIDANYNWWGSNNGADTGSLYNVTNPLVWMILNITASPSLISASGTSTITVNLTYDNIGIYHNPASGHVPDGIPVNLTTTLGTINQVSIFNGIAQAILNSGNVPGTADVSAAVDSETLHTQVIIDTTPPKVTANQASGIFNSNINVKLSSESNAAIYYRINSGSWHNFTGSGTVLISNIGTNNLEFYAVDIAGNPSAHTTCSYIIDKTAPKLIATSPKNGAIGVSRTATIAIKFSEKIKASVNWSKVYIKNLRTGKKVPISKWISGNTLYIKTSLRRYAYTWYQVYIPAYAIKDYAGNYRATGYSFKFKTGRR